MITLHSREGLRPEILDLYDRALGFKNHTTVSGLMDKILRNAGQIYMDLDWIRGIVARSLKFWNGELGRHATDGNIDEMPNVDRRLKTYADQNEVLMPILDELLKDLENHRAHGMPVGSLPEAKV